MGLEITGMRGKILVRGSKAGESRKGEIKLVIGFAPRWKVPEQIERDR